MTVIPRDIAKLRPANQPEPKPRKTINGHVVAGRKQDLTTLTAFLGALLIFLLTGLLLSLLQQAH